MPSDDYAGFVPGALKLKGAKVTKAKKKKSKASKEAEQAISTAAATTSTGDAGTSSKKERRQRSQSPNGNGDNDEDVATSSTATMYRTKAEQAREETQRRRMLQMMEPGKAKPDLLKTHKERVEELNTYLSRLSEHHDMPKIGPG